MSPVILGVELIIVVISNIEILKRFVGVKHAYLIMSSYFK